MRFKDFLAKLDESDNYNLRHNKNHPQFVAGLAAWKSGKAKSNPHDPKTHDYIHWQRGYDSGLDEGFVQYTPEYTAGYAAHKAGKSNVNNYFMSQVGESLDDYANKGGMHPTQSDAEYNHKKSTHYQATFTTSKGLDYSVRRKDLPVGHPQWSHSVVL